MSSFISHALIGSVIGLREKNHTQKEVLFIGMFFACLGISPDIDYFFLWILNYNLDLRYTHSIGFCFLVGSCAFLLKKTLLNKVLNKVPPILLFLAPLSHLILDYFVGVHANPFIFPFNENLFVFPFGILPSAGRLDPGNYFFWRNLLIELGITIPVAILIIPRLHRLIFRSFFSKITIILIFSLCVFIGINLQR